MGKRGEGGGGGGGELRELFADLAAKDSPNFILLFATFARAFLLKRKMLKKKEEERRKRERKKKKK